MEFKKIKQTALLSENEINEINDLVDKGNNLLTELKKECTFNLLKKLITNYSNIIINKKTFIESLVERTLGPEPQISIHIDEIIKITNNLINFLKQASVINNYAPLLLKKFQQLLAHYKVFVDTSFSVKYYLGNSIIKKHKIVLNLTNLDIGNFIKILVNYYHEDLKGFLFTEENLIESKVVESFLQSINKENLKEALKKDNHSNFIIKAYIMLSTLKKDIKDLVNNMNSHLISNDNSFLNSNIMLIKKELNKVSDKLVNSLKIIQKARLLGVKTQKLVNEYNETFLLENSISALKSYLRYKFNINDLPEQFAYEFLTIYDAVPEELVAYEEFAKRSPYLFLKSFFS